MKINENAFDDLLQSSDDIMQDVIDDNIPDINDFKYKIHITISGIVPQIRKCNIFYNDLQRFDKTMNILFEQSRIFDEVGPCIYTVAESDMVLHVKWFAEYKYKKPVNNKLYTNSYNLRMFNDENIVEDDELMNQYAKNFSFVFQCNINESLSNVINILKFIKITIEKVVQRCFTYNGKSKCKVFSMWIRKTTSDEKSKGIYDYFSQSSSYLENLINKKDDDRTRNIITKLTKFLLNRKDNTLSDKWFSSGTVSADVQDIIKYFGIKVTDVYVDEDDNSVRIEVPQKVTMKCYNFDCVVYMIQQTKKFFCFTVNGKFNIHLSSYNAKSVQTFLDKCLYPNINQLFISTSFLDDNDYNKIHTIDLSRFYINDLKIQYSSNWYNRNSNKKWDIKLNPSSKPKKFKETERH